MSREPASIETIYTRVVEDPFKTMNRRGYRWFGTLLVEINKKPVYLLMTGSISQWFRRGEPVKITLREEPKRIGHTYILGWNDYELYRVYHDRETGEREEILVWPPWTKKYVLERRDPLDTRKVYEYHVVAREALTEQDYMDIVGLEQYHYASREEIVAVWRCPVCGEYMESNTQPRCPRCGVPMKLQEIRGSLPSSRFLVLELVQRKPFEPRIIGYVRVDTPIPLMNRRLPDGTIERMIREKVFPKTWFHPTYWPSALEERRSIIARYRELRALYRSGRLARSIVGEEVSEKALKIANTAAARIARVVIHPDYRGDGLGVLAVNAAVEWVMERRIPEMRKRKHVVETIAMMARYNPFFEKAGFYYMWDTGSGRPVLMKPLTDEARERIMRFLKTDKYARLHGGRLFHPRYATSPPITGPIRLVGVSKKYTSLLDVDRLPPSLREILIAFGVERRLIERYVLRGVNIAIEPGDTAVVVGASGAGKTTFLRMIIGAATGLNEKDQRYRPDEGDVEVPENTRIAYMLPGEHEPVFGDETLLEHVARKLGDAAAAVEILNAVGLGDAVFYRGRFNELSTGQKERAKLASLLAERPNLLIIDEFTAHLDSLTAMRVARKIGRLAKKHGITLVVATNRSEIIDTLNPDKIIFIGYGTAHIEEPRRH